MEKFGAKNILLVDDDERFLNMLADHLRYRSNDFRTLTAENGEQALKVLESEHVDLVVTDLKMPVMDGFGLVVHMKRAYPQIPVIVVSSFVPPEVESQLRGMSVSQCIEKTSLDVGTLGEMIMRIWQGG